MIFRLFKQFPSLSYRKKLPLSSVFNPHEHEAFETVPKAGERPAAARGELSHPAKSNDPATRPREETDETQHKKPKGGRRMSTVYASPIWLGDPTAR